MHLVINYITTDQCVLTRHCGGPGQANNGNLLYSSPFFVLHGFQDNYTASLSISVYRPDTVQWEDALYQALLYVAWFPEGDGA